MPGIEPDLYYHHLASFDDCTKDHLEDCTHIPAFDFKEVLGRLIVYYHAVQHCNEPGRRIRPTEVLGLDNRTYETLLRLDHTSLVQNLLHATRSTFCNYVELLEGFLEDPKRAGNFYIDGSVYAQIAHQHISQL